MARYWTSDLHLGHVNIIRYCDRPFPDVDSMNRALIERWNEVVSDADEVWVLGDVAMGRIDDSLALVGQLRGHKILFAGNHDRCWHGHGSKADRWIDRYHSAGFETIVQGQTETMIASVPVLCSHFPYRGDSFDTDRHLDHRPIDCGSVLLHGHVHQRWKVNGRQVNVGVDVWDYRPVADDEILDALGDLTDG